MKWKDPLPTEDTFVITVDGQETVTIGLSAKASDIEDALNNLNLPCDSIKVSDAPNGGFTLTFAGSPESKTRIGVWQ
jgi:hypothetical protein